MTSMWNRDDVENRGTASADYSAAWLQLRPLSPKGHIDGSRGMCFRWATKKGGECSSRSCLFPLRILSYAMTCKKKRRRREASYNIPIFHGAWSVRNWLNGQRGLPILLIKITLAIRNTKMGRSEPDSHSEIKSHGAGRHVNLGHARYSGKKLGRSGSHSASRRRRNKSV